MKVNGIPRRTIQPIENNTAVEIIDQTALPFEIIFKKLTTSESCIEAIQSMRVRGAPLIGVTGAWAMALATLENPVNSALIEKANAIMKARPTAVNLMWAVQKMMTALMPADPSDRVNVAIKLALQMTQDDVMTNRKIGEFGFKILSDLYQQVRRPLNILTHCNAGWLATVDYGTALSPIYFAHERNIPVHVWVDETRPRNQGYLTAWELEQQGIAHTLIADNAGGLLMRNHEVDLVIVGADRITKAGDVANKIGTYLKALAANDCDVPFYVAAPLSTVDWHTTVGGRDIEIEYRNPIELTCVQGLNERSTVSQIRLTLAKAALNPAFDVTPSRLVSALITDQGIVTPEQLVTLQSQF